MVNHRRHKSIVQSGSIPKNKQTFRTSTMDNSMSTFAIKYNNS